MAPRLSDYTLPNWVKELRTLSKLAPGGLATLVTIATDPEAWLLGIINKWVVQGALDAGSYVLGWFIFAFERTASIIAGVAGPLASPFSIVETALVGAIESMYEVALGVAQTAGLAGPPAAAFAIALISVFLAAIVYGLLSVIPGSDALEGGLEAIK